MEKLKCSFKDLEPKKKPGIAMDFLFAKWDLKEQRARAKLILSRSFRAENPFTFWERIFYFAVLSKAHSFYKQM